MERPQGHCTRAGEQWELPSRGNVECSPAAGEQATEPVFGRDTSMRLAKIDIGQVTGTYYGKLKMLGAFKGIRLKSVAENAVSEVSRFK